MKSELKDLRTSFLHLKELEISIGKEEIEDEMVEPLGPTPMPSIPDLREWDMELLSRYKPFYSPICDLCCFCTYGKCDLTGGKGACGIEICEQTGRWSLLQAVIGMCTHMSHAKEIVEWLIEKKGPDLPLELGDKTPIEAPIIRTVTGIIPKKLGDLKEVIKYMVGQVPDLIAALHIGQEGNYLDFESKALHAGMIDALAMETADIAQICALDFPRADPDAPLVEIGFGSVDTEKPVILCIGHNVAPGSEIIDYARKKGVYGDIEVCALCCTAHDITRYSNRAKIVGPMSREIKFVRSGIADVIVVDEQCIRTDILKEAMKVESPLISTSPKAMHGLPDRTEDDADEIVRDLLNGAAGALILDPEKAGEVAVRVAVGIFGKRRKVREIIDEKVLVEFAKRCQHCEACVHACPNSLPISEAMYSVEKGDFSKLGDLEDFCLGCTRCEEECKRGIPILSMMAKVSRKKLKEEKYKIRCGRGAIQDFEIREVAPEWVSAGFPGVVALVGCANYSGAAKDVYYMAEEFLKAGFIVIVSGCAAMTIGMYTDEEGRTLYERYGGAFSSANLINVGSCVANSHIISAGIRLGSVFGRRILRANFAEAADYNLNKIPACGIAWGAMSQKAHAIATACNRFGIPVIVGPQGSKYRRLYLGKREDKESFCVKDVREGEKRYQGCVPEHLLYAAETKEEAIVLTWKLCIRHNDVVDGRQARVGNYILAHRKYFGTIPDDLDVLIRTKEEIPPSMKEEILPILEKKGWKPVEAPDDRMRDVTLLPRKFLWTSEAQRKGLKWWTV
ncbi:MAG: CO dehydrogenase/acetyl-CoA synthase complex subunit alpha [Candidatus Syntropharchaeia archaeon]